MRNRSSSRRTTTTARRCRFFFKTIVAARSIDGMDVQSIFVPTHDDYCSPLPFFFKTIVASAAVWHRRLGGDPPARSPAPHRVPPRAALTGWMRNRSSSAAPRYPAFFFKTIVASAAVWHRRLGGDPPARSPAPHSRCAHYVSAASRAALSSCARRNDCGSLSTLPIRIPLRMAVSVTRRVARAATSARCVFILPSMR